MLPADVVAGPGGEVYLAGAFGGGQLQLGATYNGDFFVGRFTADGQPSWVESWTLGASEEAFLGIDGSDGLYVVGDFIQAGFPSGCPGPGRFLAKLNTSGQFQFCKEIAETGPPIDLAVLPSGQLATAYLSGANAYTVEIFDGSGNSMGQTSFSAPSTLALSTIVSASTGDGFLIAGEFGGMGTFAGHIENAMGTRSGFVTLLDANLAHVWTRSFGTDVFDVMVAGGPSGYAVAASFEGGADLGAGEVLSSNRDLLVALLDGQGQALWSQRIDAGPGGGGNAVAPTSLTLDLANNVTVAGVFRDSITLGQVFPAGSQDPAIFLGKLAGTNGTVLHGRAWPQGEHNTGAMSTAPDGAVWWLGDGSGLLDFGGGEIEVLTDTCFLVGYER